MQLYRFLCNDFQCLTNPRFGRRHRAASFDRVSRAYFNRSQRSHRTGLLKLHEHLRHPMLQCLKFT